MPPASVQTRNAVCHPPQATPLQRPRPAWPSVAVTRVGASQSFECPCPSWPYRPHPYVQAIPSWSRSAACLRPQLTSATRGGCAGPRPHGQATGSRSVAAGSPRVRGRHDHRLPSSAKAITAIPVATATATNLLLHFEPLQTLSLGRKIAGGASSPSCQLTNDPRSVNTATSPSQPTDSLANKFRILVSAVWHNAP